MNTEDFTQADINRAKIRTFALSIVTQFAVLTVVIFATFYAGEISGWVLNTYVAFLALGFFSYFMICITSPRSIARRDLSRYKLITVTPTGGTMRGIGIMFSLIEIPILLTHGFIFIGVLWAATEIVQFIGVRQVKKAIALQDSGEVEVQKPTLESIVTSPGKLPTKDEFSEVIEPKLEKFTKEISNIYQRIRKLYADNNGAPPPEGSANHTEAQELEARKEKLVLEMEDAIVQAAMKSDSE